MPDHETSAGPRGGDPAPRFLTVDLQTPYGSLKGKLPVPEGGWRLSELAWNAMALDEKLIGLSVNAESKQGREISCRKGCGACCRQAVPVSPAEAWMLADFVAAFPPARKDAVLARFAGVKARLEREGFGSRSLSASAGMDQVQVLGLDYFRLGLACPFLEDESCSIHAQRPSACREYLVTSPAAHCADPGLHPVRPVPLAAGLTEALARLCATVLGGEPQVIPMALALDWAVEHREQGRGRYDAASLLALLIETLTVAPR